MPPALPTSDIIHKFIRDKYSKRFPELESLVPNALDYIRTVKVGAVGLRVGGGPALGPWWGKAARDGDPVREGGAWEGSSHGSSAPPSAPRLSGEGSPEGGVAQGVGREVRGARSLWWTDGWCGELTRGSRAEIRGKSVKCQDPDG